MKKIKILYVQPVQSPYLTPRLEALATDPELEIVLVLEQDQSSQRPGWKPVSIEGCSIDVMNSKSVKIINKYEDFDYQIAGIRVIPWQLPSVIWRHRPDVVVVCNATELMLALIPQIFLRFRIMINVEDTLHAIRNKSFIGKALKAWAYRKADIQLAFGSMAEVYLRSIGLSDSIRRTSWSLNLEQFKRENATREMRRSELKLGDRLTFLFVGMLIPRKGIMPMLRAWAEMLSDFRAECSLVIIGSGAQSEEAHVFVKNCGLDEIIFIDRVPYEAMPSYYAAADIFILPTLQDLFSLVVVEAMAAGCAIMTTPHNGASELVNDGVNGWLFDSSDDSGIRQAFVKAYDAREKIPAMGQASQADIQPYNTTHVMSELSKILKSV